MRPPVGVVQVEEALIPPDPREIGCKTHWPAEGHQLPKSHPGVIASFDESLFQSGPQVECRRVELVRPSDLLPEAMFLKIGRGIRIGMNPGIA